jgi:hypothetical protein
MPAPAATHESFWKRSLRGRTQSRSMSGVDAAGPCKEMATSISLSSSNMSLPQTEPCTGKFRAIGDRKRPGRTMNARTDCSRNMTVLTVTLCALTAALVIGCGGSNRSSDNSSNLVGTNSVPTGDWGSATAELEITSTQVTFMDRCGSELLNGPITPNANGDFVITGPFASNIPITNATYTGHAQAGVMTLTVSDPSNSGVGLGTYTLHYGVINQVVVVGGCP